MAALYMRSNFSALFVALSALLGLGCGSSEKQDAQPDESVYGIRLKAHEGLPDLDVAFRLTPGLSAAPPVEVSATHFASALGRYRADLEGRLDSPTTITLALEGGVVHPSPDAHRLPGSGEDCLAEGLGGVQMLAASDSWRTLTIQFARSVPR